MTRAEAIKIIERIKAQVEIERHLYWEKPLDYKIALDMAIDALNEVDCHCRAERSVSDGGWVDQ